MKLKEFEAKRLVKQAGIPVPEGYAADSLEKAKHAFAKLKKPVVIKAQTLAGKRGKAGGILFANDEKVFTSAVESLLNKRILNEDVKEVLVEEKLDIEEEYYLGIIFDSSTAKPTIILSRKGGMDIEDINDMTPEIVVQHPVNPLKGLIESEAEEIVKKAKFENIKDIAGIIKKLYEAFVKYDMKMIEINPLVKTKDNQLIAADSVIVLDDSAFYRHKDFTFPARTGARKATEMEIQARKIDEADYKGVAGKTFIELDGDIAVLASGGGASLTCMDALLSYGGKPANYTEYSGNPPAEKVEKLTKITLGKKGLCGCWVVGVRANFTRIDETMKGFIEGLKHHMPKYPIVIRRAGPGDQEAFAMLREAAEKYGFDIEIHDENIPLTATAKIIVEKARQFKEKQYKTEDKS